MTLTTTHKISLFDEQRNATELLGRCWRGGMVVFDKLLGRKPKQEAAVVIEASSEPIDIDSDGITVELNDHLTVHSPAPSKRVGSSRVVKKRHRTQ